MARRPDRIGQCIAPAPRFLAAMAVLPPFLLMGRLDFKLALTVLFALLTVMAGKRIRWMYFAVIGLSVCFFHLLLPWGRVLAEIGPLKITAGALRGGASRVLSVTGMVFLSLAAVSRNLTLPGAFGGLLGRTFWFFETLLEGRASLSWKNILPGIDALLMERFNPEKDDFGVRICPEEPVVREHHRYRGWPLAFVFSVVPWLLWGWTVFQSR